MPGDIGLFQICARVIINGKQRIINGYKAPFLPMISLYLTDLVMLSVILMINLKLPFFTEAKNEPSIHRRFDKNPSLSKTADIPRFLTKLLYFRPYPPKRSSRLGAIRASVISFFGCVFGRLKHTDVFFLDSMGIRTLLRMINSPPFSLTVNQHRQSPTRDIFSAISILHDGNIKNKRRLKGRPIIKIRRTLALTVASRHHVPKGPVRLHKATPLSLIYFSSQHSAQTPQKPSKIKASLLISITAQSSAQTPQKLREIKALPLISITVQSSAQTPPKASKIKAALPVYSTTYTVTSREPH